MSISRKNWSALSRLARQRTVEDEEEIERERRRKERSYSNSDPDNDLPGGNDPGDQTPNDGTQSITSSTEQLQQDFVEMLRVRDERRRMRHVETLRRHRNEEEGKEGGEEGEEGRVELLGDLEEGRKTTPTHTPIQISATSSPTTNPASQQEKGSGGDSGRDTDSAQPETNPPSKVTHKFSSSLSISFDKSPTTSMPTSPMSPRSPTTPLSPTRVAQSSTHHGHAEGSVNGSSVSLEQTARPAFARQSSRTVSFRMLKKKEEERMPLQRSASVRVASKTPNSFDQTEEDKASPFQRNSRQRVSSRSIQEKMERLAKAAQKSESQRSPDVVQRPLFLLDEVSRKRGIFEKDPAAVHGRQAHRSFRSGTSDHTNHWVSKTNSHESSSHHPTVPHHVDISSKRSIFESPGEDSSHYASPLRKMYK